MRKGIILLSAFFIFILSCKKETTEEPVVPSDGHTHIHIQIPPGLPPTIQPLWKELHWVENYFTIPFFPVTIRFPAHHVTNNPMGLQTAHFSSVLELIICTE